MARSRNRDWAIKVDLDLSGAEKRLAVFESRLRKASELMAKIERAAPNPTPKIQKKVSAEKQELALARKKEQLYAKINRLNQMGVLSSGELGLLKSRVANTKKMNSLVEQHLSLTQRVRKESEAIAKSGNALTLRQRQSFQNQRENMAVGLNAPIGKLVGASNAVDAMKNPSLQMREWQATAVATAQKFELLQQKIRAAANPAELQRLRTELKLLQQQAAPAISNIQRVTRALSTQNFVAKGLSHSLGNLLRSYVSVFAIGAGIHRFFMIGEEMESLQATMLAASGNSAQAAEDFEYVKKVALNLGNDLQESTRGYAKLGTAARAANFSVDQTRNVFLAASEASRAYGLNAQRTQLVFLAFEQMLSKGVVSMEELRRQLGEQIPGAFQTAAKAMGVSTQQLSKMVESGTLASEEFLPKFADELRRSVRESGALAASLEKVRAARQRMASTFTLQTDEGFKAGKDGFAGGFKNLTESLQQLGSAFRVFGKIMGAIFNGVASVINFLTPFVAIFTNALETMMNAFDRAGDVNVASKELTFFEAILRQIIITTLRFKVILLDLQILLVTIAEWFGVDGEKASGWGKQLLSLMLLLLTLIPILRAFGWVWRVLRWLLSPFGKLFGLIGGGAVNAASRVGILSTAFSKLSGWVSKLISLTPGLGKFMAQMGFKLPGMAAFAALPAGYDAVSAMLDDKKSKGDALTEAAGFGGALAGGIAGVKAGGLAGAAIGGPWGAAIGAVLMGAAGAWAGEGLVEDLIGMVRGNSQTPTTIVSQPIGVQATLQVNGDIIGDQNFRDNILRDFDNHMKQTMNDSVALSLPGGN